jgi:transcriptional regulator GlxA family with amidase domain
MKLSVLVLEGCMPSAVTGIGDLVALANHVLRGQDQPARLALQTVSVDGKPVRAARGVSLKVDGAIGDKWPRDAVLVPGFLVAGEGAGRRNYERRRALGWVRRQHAVGRVVAASCGGVFLLAEAGLLDGRRATTTWWLQSELKRRYPTVDVARDAVVTQADRIVCAAGPMSWVDALLRVIEIVDGAEVARLCADYAVIDTAQRTQATYQPLGYVLQQSPLLVEADMLVRCAGETPMTVRGLAQRLGISERTLHRRMTELTGEPPQAFIVRRRIELARTLLETTRQSIKTIAHAIGYEDESSFRRAFRKLTAVSPQAYRARQRTNSAPSAPVRAAERRVRR